MQSGRTWVCATLRRSRRCRGQATATVARANRLSILLADRTPSWCVLHELAHAMTSHADGRSDGHGPLFMGVYLQLIVRYLRLDPRILIDSLRDAGIEITRDARPVFVDPVTAPGMVRHQLSETGQRCRQLHFDQPQ